MNKLAFFSAGLVAAAIVATPVMARQHHATPRPVAADRYIANDAYAGPAPGALSCIPAPRVGAFASEPWTNESPCEPAPRYYGTGY